MAFQITEQLRAFGWSILLGLAAGVLYDLLRAVRLRRPRMTWALDLLYCLAAGAALSLFVLRQGDGQLRGYILLGALGGMLLDLGAFSVFGFYSIQLLVICVAIGLLVIYLMKNNLLSAAILCGGTALFLGITQFFFLYALWGYEDVFRLYLTKILPTGVYTTVFTPLFYWGSRKLYDFYQSKLEL